jgi:hypothetical protein
MKFKFLKIVLTGLIVLASASIKIVNAAPIPILSTFEWEGTCYDCNGLIGDQSDPSAYTTVHATLTLQDFDPLSTDYWYASNFVSFAYTAGSNHVFDFVINSDSPQLDYVYGTNATADNFEFYMSWDDIANNVEKAGGYSNTQEFKYQFQIDYDPINALNTWSISTSNHCNFGGLNNCFDFGITNTTSSPPTNASAPPSIFILALGLMGLSFRRSKKQV